MSIRLRNSAKAVIVRDGELLVTRNRSADDPAGDWLLLPGGGQHPGETLTGALRREVAEETGYAVEPLRLLWIREYIGSRHEFALYDAGEHQIEFMFECRIVGSGEPQEIDAHQVGIDWVPLDRLQEVRLYPAALTERLATLAADGTVGPVYLGDVN